MLRTASKGEVSPASFVSLREDRLLREAFGRYGGAAEPRAAAALVVRDYQQLGAGRWFLCDCRPDAERPPALVPVAQTHIRRHQDARWPVHCEGCDFYSEPDEQRIVTASYAAPRPRPLRLARPFTMRRPAVERLSLISSDVRRPGLARLLLQMVSDAGLQSIGPDGSLPPLIEQIKALWAAARFIEIDPGIKLAEFFCTSPAKLGELCARIAALPDGRFVTTRPHGVLVARMAAVGGGTLTPLAGAAIPVRGRLAVFGERPAAMRDTKSERAARAPYLAACVVGRPAVGEPVAVLSAYVHPCASEKHLMLVDSDLERRTLAQLRGLQSWLGRKQILQVGIEKPLFDVGPEIDDRTLPRPPLVPDFVVTADDGATAIVETMGFADAEYRERKTRVHGAMRAALAGAPVIEHDFHEPAGWSQQDRDGWFWQALRAHLTEGHAVASTAAPAEAPSFPPAQRRPP